jgi:hypothetical protein
MAQTFTHTTNGTLLGTSNTLLFGPTATGVTTIIFAGTFSNLDNTNKLQHTFTLQKYDGTTYNTELNAIPIPYGGSSKCPKIVLLPGESLYASADTASVVSVSLSILQLS